MSKALEVKTKAQLIEIIESMSQKLDMVKDEAKRIEGIDADLPSIGFSIIKDDKDKYQMVHLSFDVESKNAKVESIENLDTTDYDIALFKSKKFLVEKLFRGPLKGGRNR
jgi:predicted methyltransferase MtxX (methanogen marker protein 4)